MTLPSPPASKSVISVLSGEVAHVLGRPRTGRRAGRGAQHVVALAAVGDPDDDERAVGQGHGTRRDVEERRKSGSRSTVASSHGPPRGR